VPHLESYPHQRGPLDVVGLGEGRSPAAGTNVPDNGLDHMVIMVPIRGGRVAPAIKAAISVNPAAGASAPVRAAAMAPLEVRGCPLHRLLPRCLPHQLELVVSIVDVASTSALAAASFVIASLAALAAVAAISVVVCSCSSATAILASCRCCTLEATERGDCPSDMVR
jgi:hypothetical protein